MKKVQLLLLTTRPETMFADVGVVVNPTDERYQKHIGKKVINPANGALIPIIADSYIDVFGSWGYEMYTSPRS